MEKRPFFRAATAGLGKYRRAALAGLGSKGLNLDIVLLFYLYRLYKYVIAHHCSPPLTI